MELVDWDLAAATAGRLVRPGPEVSDAEAAAVVRELRALADEALGHVVAYTGLTPDPALRTSTAVVDRPTWARNNVAGMRQTLAPVLEQVARRRRRPPRSFALRAGRAVTGAELGTVLALLAGRVLGQYEVFLPPGAGDGRLLLVAPNIVDAERRLDVDPHDFRLWVCLHEQTHHVQFTGAPWLRAHLADLVRQLADVSGIDPAKIVARLRDAARNRPAPGSDTEPRSLLRTVQSPEQREVLDRLQAVMTLLEGHADQVMDAVGPDVVPSVEKIRTAFDERRRAGGTPLDRLIRTLLGLEVKLAQYRIGGAFCRAVAAAGGADAMRVAFRSPDDLPTRAELREPPAWLARHGLA